MISLIESDKLNQLLHILQEVGVTHFKCEAFEVDIGAKIPEKVVEYKETPEQKREREKRAYETILFASAGV